MPYVTFGRDMRAAANEGKKAIKGGGKVIAQHFFGKPEAMIEPLAKEIARLLWCALRILGYVLRKIVS